MNNLSFIMHSCFEKFIVKNNLNFSIVRDPKVKQLNNYIDKETALIFEVFTQGFRSAIEYQITQDKDTE